MVNGDDDTTSALPAGVYYLSEVTPPGGYKKLAGDLIFVISSQGTVTIPLHVSTGDPSTLVILNNLEGSGVDGWISSATDDGNTTYTIRIPNELAGVPVRIVKIDQTGKALEGPVIINIEKTENDIEVSASINGTEIPYPKVKKDQTTGVWTIKITNQSGVVLPATGGSGTGIFTIMGMILTARAGFLLLLRRGRG